MDTILTGLDITVTAILRCSAQATVLIPVLLAVRWLLGKRMGAAGRRYLWWIVDGRLLLPWSPGAPVSLFGFVDVPGWTTTAVIHMEQRIHAIASFTPARARPRIAVPLVAALAVVCWTNAATPETPGRGESSREKLGGVMALLPSGDDLGTGWSNRVTSLVDRGSPALEYFDPAVFEPARELIRSHVSDGAAFCDVSYYRSGNFVFDAWLRRAESTKSVDDEWNRLRHARLPPRLSDGKVAKRSVHRVGDLEAVLFEGDSRTLWMASGRWMLNLNLYGKMAPDEVLLIGEVFARRLGAGQPALARPVEEPSPAGDAAWYTVHALGDLYTPVRRVHTNRVALSRVFRKPDDSRAYFTITNSESVPILVWNVRVQVTTNESESNPDGWKTVSSDYPMCASGIPAGTTADACVLPPLRLPWRVAFLYTAQSLDGRPIPDFPPHLRGDHEIISEPEEIVFDCNWSEKARYVFDRSRVARKIQWFDDMRGVHATGRLRWQRIPGIFFIVFPGFVALGWAALARIGDGSPHVLWFDFNRDVVSILNSAGFTVIGANSMSPEEIPVLLRARALMLLRFRDRVRLPANELEPTTLRIVARRGGRSEVRCLARYHAGYIAVIVLRHGSGLESEAMELRRVLQKAYPRERIEVEEDTAFP
jgi:hypothetical protein